MSTKNNKTAKNAIAPKIVKSLSIVTDKKTGETHLIEENSGKVLAVNWTDYIRKEYAKCKIFTLTVNDAETHIQRIHKNSAIPLVRLRGTFRHDLTDKKYQIVDNDGIPLYIKEQLQAKKEKETIKATKTKKKEKQAAKKAQGETKATKQETTKKTETKKTEVKKEVKEVKKTIPTVTKKAVKKVTAYCPADDDLTGIPLDILEDMKEEGITI